MFVFPITGSIILQTKIEVTLSDSEPPLAHFPTMDNLVSDWGSDMEAETVGWGQLYLTDKPETIHHDDELESEKEHTEDFEQTSNLDLLRRMTVKLEKQEECRNIYYQRYIPYTNYPESLFCLSVEQFYPKMVCAVSVKQFTVFALEISKQYKKFIFKQGR